MVAGGWKLAHEKCMEKSSKPKRVKLNLAIDSSLKAAVVDVAAREGRSVSWVVAKAFTDYAQGLSSRPPLVFRREGKQG